MSSPSKLWQRWLLIVAAGTLLFGLAILALPMQFERFFMWMVYSDLEAMPRFSAEAAAYARFVTGVMAAVIVGWMIPMLYLIVGPFRRGERVAWNMLTVSLLTWFALDSIWSVASGFSENAVFNTIFLLLFAIPLAATYRHFYPKKM